MSDSLQPHEPQHARLPCPPSPYLRACSNSCPLSWWCCPTISSSVILLVLLPSILPSIRVFSNESGLHIRWPKYWSFSFSTSLLPMNIQDWFPLGLTGWSPCCPRKSLKSLLQCHSSKASILWGSAFFMVQLSHPYMTTGKTTALTLRTFVSKVTSLLF